MPSYSVAASLNARRAYRSVTVTVCVLPLLLPAPLRAASALTTSRVDAATPDPVYNYDGAAHMAAATTAHPVAASWLVRTLVSDFGHLYDSSRSFVATNTAPPLRPGPNNTLRGPDGRFVTNPNSARSTSAPASSGAPHGNSLSHPGPTDVYGLYDVDGNLSKWGISNDVAARYPSSYMIDKYYEIVHSGTRVEAAAFERILVQSNPGPLNFEPRAGVTR